jgi:hypothetical protein
MTGIGLFRLAGMVGALALVCGSAAAQERPRPPDRVAPAPSRKVFIHPAPARPTHPVFFPRHGAFYPAVAYAPYVYAPAPMTYYQPSAVLVTPPVSAPPFPTVIEYPNGRYELWGDGITTPFRWVWIPKPPPGPPEQPPPAASPPPEPPRPPKPSAERPPPPPRTIYRWTDEEGVSHWTDQLENIPERVRSRVETPALAGR